MYSLQKLSKHQTQHESLLKSMRKPPQWFCSRDLHNEDKDPVKTWFNSRPTVQHQSLNHLNGASTCLDLDNVGVIVPVRPRNTLEHRRQASQRAMAHILKSDIGECPPNRKPATKPENPTESIKSSGRPTASKKTSRRECATLVAQETMADVLHRALHNATNKMFAR